MRSVHIWFQQEIFSWFKSQWNWMLHHLIIVCIFSFILQILLFILAPHVWIPSTLKSIQLNQPSTILHTAKLSQIIISTDNHPKQKWLVNCAYQHDHIQQLCALGDHKQRLDISNIQLHYYQQKFLNDFQHKHQAFISTINLKNEQLNLQNKYIFKKWNTYVLLPIQLLRCFIFLHFLILISLLFTKLKNNTAVNVS